MAIDMSVDFEDGGLVQESYNAGNSSFHDLFDSKFNSFDPDSIISGGNGKLKSGMFDMDVEDSDLALAYKQPEPATSPKPGKWM
jgi:hypothetical protein